MVTALYRYLWRRLIRDTTTGWGQARRIGTTAFVVGPAVMFAALFAEVGHAPFVQRHPVVTSPAAPAPGGPPTRVGAPSDITVIELASKRA